MKFTIKIGRDNSNDIIIRKPEVSRSHAIITILEEEAYEVKDLASTNGTYINGQKISKGVIRSGDKLQVAGFKVDWEPAIKKLIHDKYQSSVTEEPEAKIQKTLTVGSAKDNAIMIRNEYVSSHHAKISQLKNGGFFLQDLNSRNGSFVNGIKVKSKNFTQRDIIKIAQTDLPANWIQLFLSPSDKSGNTAHTFALPTMGGLTFVDTVSILYCEGANNQTIVYLEGNKKEIVSKTLKVCGELLSRSNFSRIHKSYLVNLSHIKKYISGKDGQLILSNGKVLPVSRNYKVEFLKQFQNR